MQIQFIWRQFADTLLVFSGLDKIEFLQGHDNDEIYKKAYDIIDAYFSPEEDDEKIMPVVDPNADQYQFGQNVALPQEGFQF